VRRDRVGGGGSAGQFKYEVYAGSPYGVIWRLATSETRVDGVLFGSQKGVGGARLEFQVTAPDPGSLLSADISVEFGTGTLQLITFTAHSQYGLIGALVLVALAFIVGPKLIRRPKGKVGQGVTVLCINCGAGLRHGAKFSDNCGSAVES
jgi:hypothetical protein